jgi:hypothetical protein
MDERPAATGSAGRRLGVVVDARRRQANIYPVVAGTARYALLQVVGNFQDSMVAQRISRT